MSLSGKNPKEFYDTQYRGEQYAAYSSPDKHPFFNTLKTLLSRYGHADGRWLEVGCGRGLLQNVVEDYTGVDLSEAVADGMRKPFYCSPAEVLPCGESSFDGCWSYAVLEHVDDPEKALEEIRRVLKSGGILFLAPAWQCRSWVGQDYAWKPFSALSLLGRMRKALIPLRNSVLFRMLFLMPRRFFRLAVYFLNSKPLKFKCQPLTPNYTEYRITDADARWHMDPFEAILWFRSRGDQILSHPSLLNAFSVRSGTLVIEVLK